MRTAQGCGGVNPIATHEGEGGVEFEEVGEGCELGLLAALEVDRLAEGG